MLRDHIIFFEMSSLHLFHFPYDNIIKCILYRYLMNKIFYDLSKFSIKQQQRRDFPGQAR